jgi:hypothetical protein
MEERNGFAIMAEMLMKAAEENPAPDIEITFDEDKEMEALLNGMAETKAL